MTTGPLEWRIGLHSFQVELPDILWAKYRGILSPREALLMIERVRELCATRPCYMVNDLMEAVSLSPDAGRSFGELFPFDRMLGLVYIGGRLVHRATAKGILLAAYLTESTKDQQVPDMGHFVSTTEEACALISRLRAEAAARRPAGERPEVNPSIVPIRGPSW